MPWDEMLAAALRLGITPEVFWKLSVAEWNLIARGTAGAPLTRPDLDRLLREHDTPQFGQSEL